MSTSHELDVIVEQYHLALGEIVKGDPGPLQSMFSHRDDVTLANPFGPAIRGWDQAAETMARAASLYRDGQVVGFENLTKCVTPDLAYIVEVERFAAKVAGRDELAAVVLRVTSIFRREDGTWKIVHRHADPITTIQQAESVIQK